MLAHVSGLVVSVRPRSTRRKPSVATLRLCAHWKTATYWPRNHLLTPRNGRRKVRTPAHSPSQVLLCTSRTPSPSSSRAHSPRPRAWRTAVDGRAVAAAAPGAGQPARVQQPEQPRVTGVRVEQLQQREVHGIVPDRADRGRRPECNPATRGGKGRSTELGT